MNQSELGRTLRVLREQAGLTQIQMAAALGRSQNYISTVELGRTDIVSRVLRAWVEACGADLAFIRRGEGGDLAAAVGGLNATDRALLVEVARGLGSSPDETIRTMLKAWTATR